MSVPHVFDDAHFLITFSDFDAAMDNFVWSAKPGSDWNDDELIALNIAVVSLPPAEFFRTPDPSLKHIDSAILNSPSPPDVGDLSISDDAIEYLGCLNLAIESPQGFLTTFAYKTLGLLGFDKHRAAIIPQLPIPLTVCGKTDPIQTVSCLVHTHQQFILLVLVGGEAGAVGLEAWAIAGAIAAFQYNNNKRRDGRFDPLDAMIIPCITMTGTHPDFYLVPVTASLSNAIIIGRRPTTQTRVLHCSTIATHTQDASVGMEDTEYRKLALRRFLAFKELVQKHRALILKGCPD